MEQQRSRLPGPPWSWSEGPTPRLEDHKLIADINKTEEDVESRLLQLKRVVHGTSFFLSTAAVKQKERLDTYRAMLVHYRSKLEERAGWLKETVNALMKEIEMEQAGDGSRSPLAGQKTPPEEETTFDDTYGEEEKAPQKQQPSAGGQDGPSLDYRRQQIIRFL